MKRFFPIPFLKKHKKKKVPTEKVIRDKYKFYLEQVNAAFRDIFVSTEGYTPELRKRLLTESKRWLSALDSFDSASFKAGTCFGAYQILKRLKDTEAKKPDYIS